MALISSACSSTPRWMLRHDRRFVPPCLRAFHLPSPSALMPGLSIRRCRRPLRATRGDNHRQGLLTPAQSAQVGNPPVQADQAQKALDEACGLPERHAEQNLYRQAGLDRGIAELAQTAALAGRRRHPDHLWIKPDQTANHAASELRCKAASCQSCSAAEGGCSWRSATTLGLADESYWHLRNKAPPQSCRSES